MFKNSKALHTCYVQKNSTDLDTDYKDNDPNRLNLMLARKLVLTEISYFFFV